MSLRAHISSSNRPGKETSSFRHFVNLFNYTYLALILALGISEPCLSNQPVWPVPFGSLARQSQSSFIGPRMGCVKWSCPVGGSILTSPVIGLDGQIYLVADNNKLIALDKDGVILWDYPINTNYLTSLAVDYNGILLISSDQSILEALTPEGAGIWHKDFPDDTITSITPLPSDRILITTVNGLVYLLDSQGTLIWHRQLTSSIVASPAIDANGTIYVTEFYQNQIYALNSKDGSNRWHLTLPERFPPNQQIGIQISPVLNNSQDTLYVLPSQYPILFAIDSVNGTVSWQTSLVEDYSDIVTPNDSFKTILNARCWTPPAVGPDETIYFSLESTLLREPMKYTTLSQSKIIAIAPDGSHKWETPCGIVGNQFLTVDRSGFVYAAGEDGDLTILNPQGHATTRFTGKQWLTYPIITKDNTLIVADSDGLLWAVASDNCLSSNLDLTYRADLNRDGRVNLIDFAWLTASWMNCSDPNFKHPLTSVDLCTHTIQFYLPSDINSDQYIDSADLSIFSSDWITLLLQ